MHVFADAACYPPKPDRAYEPPAPRRADLDALHACLGIDRAVLVQPALYGTDHRLLLDCLRMSSRYRGVAVVNDHVSEEELTALHHAGIRAARINLGGPARTVSGPDEMDRSVRRIERLGWHAKLGGSANDLLTHAQRIRRLQIVTVLDHLAGIEAAAGPQQPVFALALDLLREEHRWILLSNADRRSSQPSTWEDMVPYVQACVAAAPRRSLWASDWPHLLYARPHPPTGQALLGLLERCVPDEQIRRRILVDNAAELYGFPSNTTDG